MNGGPDPVTIAQVTVDDAFWTFTMAPSNTVPRLGRATIEIPYPWVQDEAHEITLLSSTGLTFSHEIEVATVTPPVGPLFFGVFAIIGLYVGVIPVAIGLLWYPFLRRLERKWTHFVLALTAGLLIFLGVDALEEALQAAQDVAGAYQGSLVVLLGVVGTVLLLQSLSRRSLGDQNREGRRALAYLVAVGIGLHNLGEGLAIGASYSLGDTTEGLAIVSPVAKDRPKISTLVSLGLVAGVPTIFGAWLGGMAYSPLYATLLDGERSLDPAQRERLDGRAAHDVRDGFACSLATDYTDLTLRTNPDPPFVPQQDSVVAELAELVN